MYQNDITPQLRDKQNLYFFQEWIVQTYFKTNKLFPSSHYLKKALVGVQLKLDCLIQKRIVM